MRDSVTVKRQYAPRNAATNILEEMFDDVPDSTITIPDLYESYFNSLPPGQPPEPMTVAKESHALQSIKMLVANQEEVECIVDSESQIMAMSQELCHHLGLSYDPTIRLNMQSANGEIDQSLGLAKDIPCKID